MQNPYEENEDVHTKKKKQLQEEDDSQSLSSIKDDMKSLLSSSRKFFKNTVPKKSPSSLKVPRIPKIKSTSAVGRSMGFIHAMSKMTHEAFTQGDVNHERYMDLIKHESPEKKKSTQKSTPTNKIITEEKGISNRGRPKGSKNKPKENKTTKTPSDKKHDEEQTAKIESKVEKSSQGTNTVIKDEIARLIKSNVDMEKARIRRADNLRRRGIDWSPEDEKSTPIARPKKSTPKKQESITQATPSGGGFDLPNIGVPKGLGGMLSKMLGGAKALGSGALSTLTGSVSSAGAGAVGAGVAGAGVAGLAIGNYLTESGMLGEDMAKGYSVGDFMSSWFGEGTRNIKRHIDIEKKKELKKADKTFKIMSPRPGPWSGVTKQRMAELRRNPSKYGKVIEAYYRLWMQECEFRVTANVMSTHEDAEKMGPNAIKDANDMWKIALDDRLAFKKKHIEGPKAENSEKKLAQEQKKALQQESKDLDSIAVSSGKSPNNTTKTSPTKVSSQGGSATGNAQQKNVSISSSGSKDINTQATLNAPKLSGVVSNNVGSKTIANVSKSGKGVSFDNVVGSKTQANFEAMKTFLLKEFAPVLASHIVKQSDDKRKENMSKNRHRKGSNQNIMGSPDIFL